MPRFSHLRSDYPLNLTLVEHVNVCPLTWFYVAGLTPRTILISRLRHHDPVLISFYPRSCANRNSSVFAALTNKSTCGLTPAHASVRVYQLDIDEQLTTSSNVDVHIRVAALNSKSYGRWLGCCCTPLPCVVCWVPFSNGNGQKECTRLCRPVLRCPWTSEQVKSDKEEHMMSQSRGAVSFEPLFTAEEIGLGKEAHVEHVMKVFVTLGEGLASRWIEMPRGVLLLQTVPDDPASGAIYLYDRELQVFYFVVFDEGRDDSLTTAEFDELVAEYNLVSWTAHPALLRKAIGKTAMA